MCLNNHLVVKNLPLYVIGYKVFWSVNKRLYYRFQNRSKPPGEYTFATCDNPNEMLPCRGSILPTRREAIGYYPAGFHAYATINGAMKNIPTFSTRKKVVVKRVLLTNIVAKGRENRVGTDAVVWVGQRMMVLDTIDIQKG